MENAFTNTVDHILECTWNMLHWQISFSIKDTTNNDKLYGIAVDYTVQYPHIAH